jgi:transposase
VVSEADLAGECARLRAANTKLRECVQRQASELDPLRTANAGLRAHNAQLAAQVEELLARAVEQDGRIETLTAQVAELQRRLGRDSSNSSMPPSAEGLRKKPAVPRQRGARKPGKQPGAEGTHLAQVDVPDKVVSYAPPSCRGCGSGLDDASVVGIVRRQVFDLPHIGLFVTEHQAQQRICGCGTVTTAAFPSEASAPACYGSRVRAAIAYLQVWQHLPVDRAAQALSDLFNVPIATGTVAGVMAQTAEAVKPAVTEIAAQVAAAQVANFDETGARVAGRGRWVHTAATPQLSHYHVDERRGKVGMDAAGVLPTFSGIAVHDCWSPYDNYNGITHALCNAHLLRDLAAVAELGEEQDWAVFMADLLRQALGWVNDAKAAGQTAIAAELLASLLTRYDGHVAQGRQANPPPAGRRRAKGKPAALVERLAARRDDILRFAVDFRVPFDNNLAERALRMIKLQIKISGCWRTLKGAQDFCAVRSYIATARQQGHNVLAVLRQALQGQPWIPQAPATQPLPAAA